MVQSLERAFAILDEVAQRPAGVTAIAERVRLPKSTVARLLATLEEVDAVERFDGARWRIGPGVAALSFAVTPERSLISIARPFLADLVAELGEDAGLGLPDGNEILYVDQVESDNPVQVRDWTGARAPMHAVPSGLVLLAEWPEDALAAYLSGELVALTRRTMTDPSRLRKRLAEVRRLGCAWGLEEFAEGINSVAAPVRDARGKVVAAIHVHGPAYRFPKAGEEDRIVDEVLTAARAIDRLLARDERGRLS
ncbi:MAG TPA: IclR family transcriptional regulator [Gaiellaceae bacterium]|nr:IclR family transcriptional regulator [Gaiellaceae bacterium]